ncbi:MAG TPA: UDP-glucose--hexose-1-phosphate uridylyltransferase [Candidatus Acidoferrum sp.]|nr:UDP-glucose--hexose-1-phosphate uridylyltransferase [Candidatus Acidoferrum sp.]
MELDKLQGKSHRRYNPLTRDWILVSPNRMERPWQGQTEPPARLFYPSYDPDCYLCPENARAEGARNPKYSTTFVFDNDFAALQSDVANLSMGDGGKDLLIATAESGICRVVCFSPRHDLTLAQMSTDEIGGVVEVWAEEYRRLGDLPQINHVQIFENRGAMMGCSNPHPHGQIWATQSIPNEPRKEQKSLEEYRREHRSCMLCDYAALELVSGERIVCQNATFLAVVPFWATWPFETLVLSKRHVTDIDGLDAEERADLAEMLKRLPTRYDNLFQTLFPYSMGFHQRPTDGKEHGEWHFHAHFFPPLLRSASIKKFMVGFELLASPQRDVTPEVAAERLREVTEEHYLGRA